jgi:hypothetical protein
MNTRWTDDQVTAAVAQSMKEKGLHSAFTPLVRSFLLDASDEWRVCCQTNCDPCVNDLAPAVDRARELLGAG